MERTAGPLLSVVAPVFNEEESVQELVSRIMKSCRTLNVPFEVVLVNDGSRDQTLERLILLSRTIPELRVLDLRRNYGHMPALSAGIFSAEGEAVVTLDGDLQDRPELIPELFARWRSGAEVVYALRTQREEPFLQKTATHLFYWILKKTSDPPIPAQIGTFGLMDRKVTQLIAGLPERSRYFAGLRAWAGGKEAFVPYIRPARACGKSKVGYFGLFRLARTALVSFSKLPLRYASLLSMCLAFVLLMVGVAAVGIRLFTDLAVPGWATYTGLLGLMGFVQSLVLAILAEYVAVIYEEIKGRPLYVVRQEFVGGEPKAS